MAVAIQLQALDRRLPVHSLGTKAGVLVAPPCVKVLQKDAAALMELWRPRRQLSRWSQHWLNVKESESHVPALQTNLLEMVEVDEVFEVVVGVLEVMDLMDVETKVDERGVCARQVHALDNLSEAQFAGTYDGPAEV